ncbi:MAG: hypothetical protein L0H31_03400 [Nocardioidaceae bacterium]|nr:hypothetical protein [Nocardioidaceae bacterium]
MTKFTEGYAEEPITDCLDDSLAETVAATHDLLADRLSEAEDCRPTRSEPRARQRVTDPFLASTSRHVAAATAVFAQAAQRHLSDGRQLGHELSRRGLRLEGALFATKGKLYGSSYLMRRPWSVIWEDVEEAFDGFCQQERRLVEDLVATVSADDRDGIADRLYRAEQHVPTRPHPYLPHLGIAGRVARGVVQHVDHFWDTAEGRMVPDPVRPRRSREGPIVQYLLADPHVKA